MECVRGYVRFKMASGLQLVVIGVEDNILFPLLVHVTGVPQRTELHDQWFKGFDVREGHTFRHLPCDEND
jgi:hypothetical protein